MQQFSESFPCSMARRAFGQGRRTTGAPRSKPPPRRACRTNPLSVRAPPERRAGMPVAGGSRHARRRGCDGFSFMEVGTRWRKVQDRAPEGREPFRIVAVDNQLGGSLLPQAARTGAQPVGPRHASGKYGIATTNPESITKPPTPGARRAPARPRALAPAYRHFRHREGRAGGAGPRLPRVRGVSASV